MPTFFQLKKKTFAGSTVEFLKVILCNLTTYVTINIFAYFLFSLFMFFFLHNEISYAYIAFLRLFIFVIEYLHIKIVLLKCKGSLSS